VQNPVPPLSASGLQKGLLLPAPRRRGEEEEETRRRRHDDGQRLRWIRAIFFGLYPPFPVGSLAVANAQPCLAHRPRTSGQQSPHKDANILESMSDLVELPDSKSHCDPRSLATVLAAVRLPQTQSFLVIPARLLSVTTLPFPKRRQSRTAAESKIARLFRSCHTGSVLVANDGERQPFRLQSAAIIGRDPVDHISTTSPAGGGEHSASKAQPDTGRRSLTYASAAR